jgi:putative flippase GtrA
MTASATLSGGRLLAWLRAGGAVKLIKFGLGSIVAAICSAIAFALCYGTGLLSTTPASAVAFVAGAIPNYFLNRRWAWQRQGRVDFWREVVLYAVISLVSFAASAAATGAASRATQHLDGSVRTALVTGAYVATYAALFFAKFLCYEIVVFADRSAPRRAS